MKAITAHYIRILGFVLMAIICSAGVLFRNSPVIIIGAVIGIAGGLIWAFFGKCPHCGEFLGRNMPKHCPHCGEKTK